MGIITLHQPVRPLGELTRYRPLAAVPFAGGYRLIDFCLSGLVNAGVQNVGVLVYERYRALMNHLRSGKEWDLARKQDGLFILPPQPQGYRNGVYRGDVEDWYQNLDYLVCSRQPYVLLTGSHCVAPLNYAAMLRQHQESGAAVTVAAATVSGGVLQESTYVLTADANGRVVDMRSHAQPGGVRSEGLDTYLLAKTRLMELIQECYHRGGRDLIRDGLLPKIGQWAVQVYQHQGYYARLDSIEAYYQQMLALLKPEIWKKLFQPGSLVYTRGKDEPPAQYGETAQVERAMVANGCIVEGNVENSILFRGVRVERGATVRNSIIMPHCSVAAHAVLEHVICDKNVCITAGKSLQGDAGYPLVIGKGTVI